jgi:Glyoxalase/Bleomycin resistance protein/Dioxygenase superfamily
MDSREEVLKAADVLVENGIPIETGPHKHSIGQTFFLYCYEPGGNRFEIGAGGYLIFDLDWQPIVWGQAEREKGQAWGLQTVHTFHTYGTPPVEAYFATEKARQLSSGAGVASAFKTITPPHSFCLSRINPNSAGSTPIRSWTSPRCSKRSAQPWT